MQSWRKQCFGDRHHYSCALDGVLESRFFGAHLRVELDADGGERLVGFNASEEPTSALLNFFEYDSGFRLLNKVTHRLQVCIMAPNACLLLSFK